jgi:integrase
MARPRRDGTPAGAVNKRRLTDLFVQSVRAGDRLVRIWDERCPHLALVVRPTGKKTWTVAYQFHGRGVWYHVGDARVIGLADARQRAREVMLDVMRGRDPAAERKAERSAGTFADLASQYVELHARRHNKSWRQAERLVARHLIPRWGNLKAQAITRSDVRAVMVRIEAPILANLVLASASAIFSWAVRQEILPTNPCKLVERNPTTDRERVLSDAEIPLLWGRLDAQLRLILLTGQRPGEVAAMRRSDIVDGFWQMPGKPTGDWPGTKNGKDHRVWLSEPALALIDRHLGERVGTRTSASHMRRLVEEAGIERATPHDLRRTHLTMITRLGFGRDAMDRVANHKTTRVTDVYDRHGYAEEDQRIMTAVARLIMSLVDETEASNVVSLR